MSPTKISNKNQSEQSDFSESNYIDFESIIKIIFKNKKLISTATFFFFIIGSIYSISRKNIWEGQFEIVLDSPNKNSMSNISGLSEIPSLANLNNLNNESLNTEVGILESPSVLMPIFNHVNLKMKEIYPNKKDLVFSKWKENNLQIKLKKNTRILQISYQNSNKDSILSVLNKISIAYQSYSGERKRRSILLAKEFLTAQKNIFQEKASESLKKAQEFAIDQDLIIKSNFFPSDQNSFLPSNSEMESIRVKTANEISNIEEQIAQINNLKNDPKELQYISLTIPALREEGLPDSLKSIEADLLGLRIKYTEKDLSIKRLIEKRELIIDLLKERAIGYLKAQKLSAQAKLLSVKRPKEVTLRYKELIREADRDEKTLVGLENQLRVVQLEEAKLEDPWQLITKPTLMEDPVGPKRLRLILLFTFLGFFVSTALVTLKENFKK